MLTPLVLTSLALAGSWFDGTRLDYWGEGPGPEQAETAAGEGTQEASPVSSSIRAADSLPFDWSNYEDPANVLFWDEGGDYVPPRPLREVMAHPTEENIVRYQAWVLRKMEVASRTQSLVWGELHAALPESPATAAYEGPLDWTRVGVVFFYADACPHCHKAFPTVHALQEAGAEVHPVYLDRPSAELPGSVPYDEELRAAFTVRGTPTWVFRYQGEVARVPGNRTMVEIEDTVRRMMAEVARKGRGG